MECFPLPPTRTTSPSGSRLGRTSTYPRPRRRRCPRPHPRCRSSSTTPSRPPLPRTSPCGSPTPAPPHTVCLWRVIPPRWKLRTCHATKIAPHVQYIGINAHVPCDGGGYVCLNQQSKASAYLASRGRKAMTLWAPYFTASKMPSSKQRTCVNRRHLYCGGAF